MEKIFMMKKINEEDTKKINEEDKKKINTEDEDFTHRHLHMHHHTATVYSVQCTASDNFHKRKGTILMLIC